MAINIVLKDIQIKRGTQASLSLENPVLLDGELCYEKDTNRLKVGNGVDVWNDLSYLTGGSGGSGFTEEEIQDIVADLISIGPGLAGDYDDANDTYTLSIPSNILDKINHLTVTSDINLDTLNTRVTANDAKISASGSIGSHSDFDISGIGDGQIPKWNASNGRFEPSSDLVGGGGAGATQLSELSDVSSSSPALNNILIANGTTFQSRQLAASDISDIQTTITNNAEVLANTAKRTYPSADQTKLAGIESNAKDDQNAIDVPYTNNGQNNVQGALNDLYSTKLNTTAGALKGSANTFTAVNTFNENTVNDKASLYLNRGIVPDGLPSYSRLYTDDLGQWLFEKEDNTAIFAEFDMTALTANRTITFPDADLDLTNVALTPEQVSRIANENLFKTAVKTSDFTISDSDIEVSSGSDAGKKIRNVVNASNTVTATVAASSIDIDDSVIFDIDTTTATLNIVPDSGQTLIGEDITATNSAIRLTGGIKRVSLFRINSTTIRVDGNYETYDPTPAPTNLYTEANAANPDNEANSTVGVSASSNGTIGVSNDSSDGSYAIELTRGAATGSGSGAYLNFSITAEIGASYTLTYDYKSTGSLAGNYFVQVIGATITESFDGGARTSYYENSGTFTANQTNLTFRPWIDASNAGSSGDTLLIDNIRLVKNS